MAEQGTVGDQGSRRNGEIPVNLSQRCDLKNPRNLGKSKGVGIWSEEERGSARNVVGGSGSERRDYPRGTTVETGFPEVRGEREKRIEATG